LEAEAVVSAVPAVAVLVIAALSMADAAAAVPAVAVPVTAAFGARAALGFLVVAADEPVAAVAVQVIGRQDIVAPVTQDPAATLMLVRAVLAVAASLAFVAPVPAVAVVAVFAVAAVFITAALRAIAAVDHSGRPDLLEGAALLVPATGVFAPTAVAAMAWRALVVLAALHAITARVAASGNGVAAGIDRADRRSAIGLIEAAQAVPAVAGMARTPIGAVTVVTTVSARDPVLVIDTAFLIDAVTELAVDDGLTTRIVAAAFGAGEVSGLFIDAALQLGVIAHGIANTIQAADLADGALAVTATRVFLVGYAVDAATAPARFATKRLAWRPPFATDKRGRGSGRIGRCAFDDRRFCRRILGWWHFCRRSFCRWCFCWRRFCWRCFRWWRFAFDDRLFRWWNFLYNRFLTRRCLLDRWFFVLRERLASASQGNAANQSAQ